MKSKSKPRCRVERVDGMCTNSGIAYDVIAPTGYCFDPGEHVRTVNTKNDVRIANLSIVKCECPQCVEAGGE